MRPAAEKGERGAASAMAALAGEPAPIALPPLPPIAQRLRATLPARGALTPGARSRGGSRLLIFGQSRCGSTLLMDLLNAHPDVDCRNEIYRNAPLLPTMLRRGLERGRRAPVFGFKLQVHQLDQKLRLVDPAGFVADLVRDGYRIVYLRRTNVLRHVISGALRGATGVTHVRTEAQADGVAQARRSRIRVDVEAVLHGMRVREFYWRAADAILADLPRHAVEYERDLADAQRHQPVADAIFALLGLPSVPVRTQLRRINTLPLRELVENFDELAAALETTPWRATLTLP